MQLQQLVSCSQAERNSDDVRVKETHTKEKKKKTLTLCRGGGHEEEQQQEHDRCECGWIMDMGNLLYAQR
jgi:hypothetical protein